MNSIKNDFKLNRKLFHACRKLDAAEVRNLLEQGADPNSSTFGLMEETLLSDVIYCGACNEYREKKLREKELKIIGVVRLLLEYGADPNKIHIDDNGTSIFTPLFYAVMYCENPLCTQLLLEAGADVNLPHDDSLFPLYDMLEMEWHYFDPEMSCEKDPDTANRKKGTWFFQFSEILLEHGARTYDMLHPAYVWEKLSEKEQNFLSFCGELDRDSVSHALKETPELIGISDKRNHHYGFYVTDWASHIRRRSFRGNRQEFEETVIGMMRFLIRHDPSPETALMEAAMCAVDKGYPLLLEWSCRQLKKCGKESWRKNSELIFNDWHTYDRFIFPEEINDRIQKVLPRFFLQRINSVNQR